MMATHPATMVSNIILLQLIHIGRVHKLATPPGILRIKLEHYLRKRWRLIGLLEGTLFRQGDLVSLLDCFAILTCLIALDDHLIACSPQHDSLSRMLDRTLIV